MSAVMPLADASGFVADHLLLVVGAVVVLAGLAGVGRVDLARFSWYRMWAISGVCFAESIRRKVLWLIPLAIVGLVAIVQLQQPADEQDAIRQTTKFCLMASGLVVVLTTLILACTSLPREIESRVIFTVVTKPTTRLEIVLGKVVGFARVSFTILLVMGVFTWGYLELRASLLRGQLRQRLAEGAVVPVSRPTLQHYADAGLLNAKSLADPESMNVYGRPPVPGNGRRYLNAGGYLLVPFALPPDLAAYDDPEGKKSAEPGAILYLHVGYDPAPAGTPAAKPPTTGPAPSPQVNVQVFNPDVECIIATSQVTPDGAAHLKDASGTETVTVPLPRNLMPLLRPYPFVFVALSAQGTEALWVEDRPERRSVEMYARMVDGKVVRITPYNPVNHDLPGQFIFTGRQGTFGQQIKGAADGGAETCVYHFHDVDAAKAAGPDGQVPIELRSGIEKNGDIASADLLTDMRLTVTDTATGRQTDVPGVLHPENNRTLYGSIPAAACGTSKDFDVAVRCYSGDQWVGLRPNSMSVVRADGSFGLNLAKSLSVLWLLSVLVTAISVFCSTFLTWPTAVVLTLVLLFGRWGLNELGDAASAGLGRQFVSDFGIRDPSIGTSVATSVDTLNKGFKAVASVLPDVSAFSATDAIDRGLTIPGRTVWDATATLVGFGLPLVVAAFVILKFKEVAP